MKVALLGATDQKDRYAYKAFKKLTQAGHLVYLIHPKRTSIDHYPVFQSLANLPEKPHTVTLYVSPEISTSLREAILQSGAQRVVFNPGTENPVLENALEKAGIHAVRDCTLRMLDAGRF